MAAAAARWSGCSTRIFRPAFDDPAARPPPRRRACSSSAGPVAFTTDSYVVQPLFFPGGDIGTLAVNGTVNDLAMCGARPLYLSVGFILEEGLPIETLRRDRRARCATRADAAGVRIVTGDTKVVDRGKGDGIFINTAGHRAHRRAATPIGPAACGRATP